MSNIARTCNVCSHNESVHSGDGCDVFYCRCAAYRAKAVAAEPIQAELLSTR